MAERHSVGGGIGDFVIERTADQTARFSGGAVLQFWNARDGGTQYDMTLDKDGTTPAPAPLSSDGTDDLEVGDIPELWLPPDVFYAYVSADGGPRRLIIANDVAAVAQQIAAQFAQHVTAQNGHGTTFATLADAAFPSSPPDGALIAYDADTGTYTLVAGTGLNPADFVKTAGGSTIRIPDGNTTLFAQEIRLPASRTNAPDAFQVWWNAGSNSAPSWLEVFWLASTGEPRVQASADNRVALKVQRRSASATADQMQWCSEAGTPLAWVAANGSLRAPNITNSQPFTVKDTVTAGSGKFYWRNQTGVPVTLRALSFYLDTAATSGAVVFDPKVNGTSLYPTGKPQLTAGTQDTGVITAAFNIPAGARVGVDISGTFSGAKDLTAQLDFS